MRPGRARRRVGLAPASDRGTRLGCARLAVAFEDERFDRVLSAFGVQFAPRHEIVAQELARVCRPGGRIGRNEATDGSLLMHAEYLVVVGRKAG
jgi:SAM-dependent methyltransferase